MGDHDLAIESGERGLRIAEAHGDFALRVATNIYLGHVYHDTGGYRRASDFFRQNVGSLVDELSRERFGLPYVPSVHSRTWLVFCLGELGEFSEGLTRAKEAVQIAESVEHFSSLTSAYCGLGRIYLRRGDLQAAIPILEHGLELARTWNIRLLFPLLAEALGSAYALFGRLSEALPLLEQAREQHSSMRGTAAQSIRVASLSQAYLLAGRSGEAMELAARALDFARTHDERGNQANALRLLGEIASCLDPPGVAEAEAYFGQAIALTEELEMRPLLARSHFGLGKLYRVIGRHLEAKEHLITATALFKEMGMPWWLEQGEAELEALL
jgi:tetratricopeptide (TPR) repeat protein